MCRYKEGIHLSTREQTSEEYSDKEGQNLRILPSSLSRNLASLVTSKEKEFYISQNASRNKKQIESLISESKYTQLYSYKNVFFC